MQTRDGRVMRAFYYQGKPTKVGEIVTLPRVFALEMAAAKKIELLEDTKPAEKPAAEQPGSKTAKESANAR